MIDFFETVPTDTVPILFLHGLGASRWMCWQQQAAFSDTPLILVDLPGHGKSINTPWQSFADTADMIAGEVIQNRAVHVVGLSLGGHVALELAKRYPKMVQSLFISGITVRPMHFGFLLKLQSRIVQRGIRNGPYLEKIAREHYHLPPGKISEFIANYQLLTSKTYETIWKEIIRFRLDGSYGHIDQPCLFAAGDQESRGIMEATKIAPEILPNAVGKLIPGAQHDWPVQQPAQFNRLLREWLDFHKGGMDS
ncbi:alpha/beta fold hydrolase [Planococcus dechangensis]|uniref:Alpha/beta fold hydrolase n=1 Tax=Planococcus dechangensis TaxID=1176255 RepID=A0ABV9M8C3_9BACL